MIKKGKEICHQVSTPIANIITMCLKQLFVLANRIKYIYLVYTFDRRSPLSMLVCHDDDTHVGAVVCVQHIYLGIMDIKQLTMLFACSAVFFWSKDQPEIPEIDERYQVSVSILEHFYPKAIIANSVHPAEFSRRVKLVKRSTKESTKLQRKKRT